MVSDLILFFVVATLVVVIVAMVRQRGSAGVVRDEPAPPPDVWLGGEPPRPGAAPPARVKRDHDALAREVLAHLQLIEERASPGLTAQVMPVFLKDTAARLDALRTAVALKDGTSAHRIAHTLHGSAATVGATSMVSICADLIREVRCGAFDRCDGLIAELTLDFEAIGRAVDGRQGR